MRTPERGSGIVGTEERSPSGSTNPKCATIRRSSRTESRLNGPSGPLPSPTFAAEDPSTSAGHLIDERRARTGARRPKEAPTNRRRPFSPPRSRERYGATKQIRRSKIQHPHSKEQPQKRDHRRRRSPQSSTVINPLASAHPWILHCRSSCFFLVR